MKSISWLCIVSLIFLTSCWDHREIEELGIITGVAIDLPEDQEKVPMLRVTNQYVLPQSRSTQVKSGSSGDKPYVNEIVTGPSILETIREQAKFVSRPPYYYHLKSVVISKDLAEAYDLLRLTYFFYRDHEIRRSVRVFISDGKAAELFTVIPEEEKVPSIYLEELSHNYLTKTADIAPAINLGHLSKHFSHKKSFIIPLATLKENAIELNGGAIINAETKKMVGTLSENETRSYNWIMEKSQGGVVQIDGVEDEKNRPFTYEIGKVTSNIKVSYKNKQLQYKVKLNFTGKLGEDWSYQSDQFNQSYIEKQEKAVEHKIKQIVTESLDKAQNEHKTDYFEFMEPFRIKYSKEWYPIKDHWNEFFTQAKIDLKINAEVDQYQDVGRKMPFQP